LDFPKTGIEGESYRGTAGKSRVRGKTSAAKNLPETSGFDDLETREGREIVESEVEGRFLPRECSRDSTFSGGSHLTTVGRVSIHGGRASKTREFEVAYASTTPSRGRGPTRGVWGAKYVRYEASARVARRRMSQKKAMGRAIFLCKLPKVSFSRPDVSFFGRKEFERLLPHTKSFKSGQLCPTDPLLPKKIAPAHKIFQIGSVIPRLTRFCHDWPSCSKAGQIGATTRQCALKKKCDIFLMPIAFSCSKTSTYSKKLRRIPQTLRWS